METLTVVSILAILMAIALPVYQSVKQRAETVNEVGAARRTIAAFLSYNSDHAGRVLPGYGRFTASDESGNPLSFPTSGRYPWRLAPYFGYEFETLYVNQAAARLGKMGVDNAYAISVSPSFGMNVNFVGGDYETLHPQGLGAHFGPFCVTRDIQAHDPSRLIVFASARSRHGADEIDGYFKITPPNMTSRMWANHYREEAHPSQFGNVHLRHRGKAVAAMMDGHVELLDAEELQDMRRWANPAAKADDPNWRLTPR